MTHSLLENNLLKLKLIPGIGNKTLLRIINDCPQIGERHINLELVRPYFKDTQIDSWNATYKELDKRLEIARENMRQNSIHVVTLRDSTYPEALKSIFDPPAIFFYKGNIDYVFQKSLAVVGSRRFTEYGKRLCEKFVSEFCPYNLSIISGLASGIDAIAHQTALRCNSHCIGVVAHGFDFCFPSSNWRLYKEVIDSDGGIISEYMHYEPPIKGNFPTRNRIIAGLAKGLLVVEAAEKSGSLISANIAFTEGRSVYAIPADVTRATFRGCNLLIKNNIASLVTDVQDVLKDFGDSVVSSTLHKTNQLITTSEERYKPILEALLNKSMSSGELGELLTCDAVSLNEMLTELELEGYIHRDAEMRWNLT